MENLIFTNEQKIFTIVGCGGNRGLAHLDMRKQIEAASKKVQLEYMISLPGSYILSYSAFPDVYSKLTTSFSYKKIEQIAKAIQSDSDPISLKTGMFYTASREAELQKNIASYNEVCQGYTISNSCKHCGICAKVCPTQNITLQNGQVSFGENCQQCMACIQWCPQRAIDYKGKASSRKRYHHINISLKDMTQYNA